MARRAKFGRAPRSQPSLMNTLVSIAREMQNREDSNIMEAWRDGGEWRGRKVTDDMVLDYWKDRESTLDPKDPTYDTVRTQIMQLRYGIEQSKMDLRHVRGDVSDREYAQFFISWSKKVPRNSEFWRVLQKDAATLLESAKARATADADRRKVERFNAFVERKNKDINIGNALTSAIDALSKETGLDLEANGDRLLELLGRDFAANPDKYRALGDAIKAGGVGSTGEDAMGFGYASTFDGNFTHDWVAARIAASSDAYGDVATRAKKDGYASQYASASEGQSAMTSWGMNLKVWSPAQTYDRAYAQFDAIWSDPNASYRDKQAAAATFAGTVGKLAQTPGISPAVAEMFQADALRAMGEDAGDTPSFGAMMIGRGGIDVSVQQTVASTIESQALMDANPGQYVYASMNPDGTFDATGKSPVGIVASAAVPSDAVFVAQPGLNGKPMMVAVKPHDVVVQDADNKSSEPTPVGKTISYYVGGNLVTMYGYTTPTGEAGWTLRSPYADGVSGETDKAGNLVLTVRYGSNSLAEAQAIDDKYGTNLAAQIGKGGVTSASDSFDSRDSEGKVVGTVTVKWDGKGFTATQTGTGYNAEGQKVEKNTTTFDLTPAKTGADILGAVIAPSVNAGGAAADTFSSPVAASVAATTKAMSVSQVAALAQDPAFQQAFLAQTMQTLGTTNPMDSRVQAAWGELTTKASSVSWAPKFDPAAYKVGLDYPGTAATDPTKSDVSINFGGQQINLPKVPAYLTQADPAALAAAANPASPMAGWAGAQSGFGYQLLQPGQTPGSPEAMTSTQYPLNPPKPSVSPTPSPTPSPKPATTPAPAPAPTPTPAPGGGGEGGGGSGKLIRR